MDTVTHLPVSVGPVEAAFDSLHGLGKGEVPSYRVVMKSSRMSLLVADQAPQRGLLSTTSPEQS